MIQIVCWLWRDEGYRFNKLFRYGPEHVNILRAMVRRNLTLPHEFVCITDDATGIDPDIRIVPLWDDHRDMGGCYVRLKAFAPAMADIIGPRFAWMDLDCVVTGNLDPVFDRPEEFVIWHNGVSNNPYCGSMVMMTAGARAEVWDYFRPHRAMAAKKRTGYIGTDQAWIAHMLPNEAVWTKDDGVLSRFHVMPASKMPGRARRLRAASKRPGLDPEADGRVVFFHGPMDPSQPGLQNAQPWIKKHWHV